MKEKMNQEQQFAASQQDAPTPCARAEELVSYLYNEASAAEAQDFEQHMLACASCRTELAEFGAVRESISDWRAHALGGLFASNAREAGFASAFDASQIEAARESGPTRARSALAALREFFSLSPNWMRAATALAALAFCALTVIAFAHFYERRETRTLFVEKPSDKVYTQQQADEMVARARREREIENQATQQAAPSHATDVAIATPSSSSKDSARTKSAATGQPARGRGNAALPSPALANAATQRRGSPALSTRERQQLAEVLLPQESREEEKLPRLSDLLGNDAN